MGRSGTGPFKAVAMSCALFAAAFFIIWALALLLEKLMELGGQGGK